MTTRRKVILSWSSGKDSAWSLHRLRQPDDVEVVALLTTFNREFGRVAIHGVRMELVRRQASEADVPLWEVPLPFPCSNEEYESIMAGVVARAKAERIDTFAFGDLFLQDIREYRERQLAKAGMTPMFPLWGLPTAALASEMMTSGLRALICSVDTSRLPSEFLGRTLDKRFLRDLPTNVDPCGENGEFHSFVWAGPMFRSPIEVSTGERVDRDQSSYIDLVPREAAS